MKSKTLRCFVSGLLLFVPLFVLLFGLVQLYQITGRLAGPLLGFGDPENPIGALILKLAVVILVLLAIYLLGVMADLPVVRTRVQRLDRALIMIIPGYAIAKGIIGGVVRDDDLIKGAVRGAVAICRW